MNNLKEKKNSSHLMKIIDALSDKLKNSRLDPEQIAAASAELDELSGYMEVNRIQAILFAAILSLNFKKRRVSVDQLAGHFGVNGIHIMAHFDDLKALQKLRWIRSDMDGESKYAMLSDINFYITRDVLDRVMNRSKELQPSKHGDIYQILAEVINLSVDFDRERISHWDLMQDVRELVDTHRELPYFQALTREGLTQEEELAFMITCQRTLVGDAEIDLNKVVQIAAGSSYDSMRLKRSIVKGENKLVKANLIMLQEGLFMSDQQITLTDIAIRRYFSEDVDLLIRSKVDNSNIQKCTTISPVRLFFNPEEQEKIHQLGRLMSRKGYKEITGRLSQRDMRTGFTILLHGAPGTGKTETVMQLALKTKRDVMRVDLSQTKSMWYGESEKKIKKIFDQYREVLKYADHVPILLFNEADGLFGIRTSQEKSNTSQTFNTMQNILLEEMENFEGILIATTNLTANFDKAFERRFLYKIAFSPPAETARKMIWRSKLPEIPKNITGKLAVEFPFSGGQIENIARKCEIDGLLNGRQPGERELRNHCLEEKLNQPQRVKVGFRKTA
jgi:hypothetical protein